MSKFVLADQIFPPERIASIGFDNGVAPFVMAQDGYNIEQLDTGQEHLITKNKDEATKWIGERYGVEKEPKFVGFMRGNIFVSAIMDKQIAYIVQ